MSGQTSLNLQFWVQKADGTEEMACELELDGAVFKFTALIDNMDIALNLTKFNVDSVNVVSDTFGKLSSLLIKTKINNGFRIGIPFINVFLAKHQIKFPSNIFGIFELSDLTLGYYDNYIFAGATPTFIGPEQSEALFIQ
jgi:hypothetical protein